MWINNIRTAEFYLYSFNILLFTYNIVFQRQTVQHYKYFECLYLFFYPTCWILQTLPVQNWSKYILQLFYNQNTFLGEPWLCVSDYVQHSRIQDGWQQWTRDCTLQKQNWGTHEWNFGLKQVRSPLLKVPWWKPKCVPWFYNQKYSKTYPNGDGLNFKKECGWSFTIWDLIHSTLWLQSQTGTAKHKRQVAAEQLWFYYLQLRPLDLWNTVGARWEPTQLKMHQVAECATKICRQPEEVACLYLSTWWWM